MNFKQTKTSSFNRRISLQSVTTTTSLTGGLEKTYTNYATVWARIRTMTGREKNDARQVQNVQSHEITIRYSSDVSAVKPTDRIKYGDRYFDIKDVRNVDEANVEIRMLCTEWKD